MDKTLLAVLAVAAICSALIVGSKHRWPVRFKHLVEQEAVSFVAHWAAIQLNMAPGDRRLRYSKSLSLLSVILDWRGSIPVEELALLAPFIDLVIDGQGPPQNLPADYDDTRPETLRRFKQRMQSEGLWPSHAGKR
jgi:hypothetical protein